MTTTNEQHIANLENAISILREVEAFLSFNTHPSPEELRSIKETIRNFLSFFPEFQKNIQSIDEFFKQQQP